MACVVVHEVFSPIDIAQTVLVEKVTQMLTLMPLTARAENRLPATRLSRLSERSLRATNLTRRYMRCISGG